MKIILSIKDAIIICLTLFTSGFLLNYSFNYHDWYFIGSSMLSLTAGINLIIKRRYLTGSVNKK